MKSNKVKGGNLNLAVHGSYFPAMRCVIHLKKLNDFHIPVYTTPQDQMQFQTDNLKRHATIQAQQYHSTIWATRIRDEKRSRKLVGRAPLPVFYSRVSRKGLPCPEVHDTPDCASRPFPTPNIVNEDDFDGFILVDTLAVKKRALLRRSRRAARMSHLLENT